MERYKFYKRMYGELDESLLVEGLDFRGFFKWRWDKIAPDLSEIERIMQEIQGKSPDELRQMVIAAAQAKFDMGERELNRESKNMPELKDSCGNVTTLNENVFGDLWQWFAGRLGYDDPGDKRYWYLAVAIFLWMAAAPSIILSSMFIFWKGVMMFVWAIVLPRIYQFWGYKYAYYSEVF